MGNHAIFTVLGLMVFFGMVSTTLNTNEAQSTKNVSAFVTNDAARDIAYDALNLARLNVDTGLANMNISSFPLRGSLLGGTYSVTATAITSAGGDTVQLSSTGTYEGTSYTVQTSLFHNVKYFPPTYKAALRFWTSPSGSYCYSETTLVDGRDHDTSGNLMPSSSATRLADISVLTSKDSATVASYMPTYKVQVDPLSYSLSYIDTLAANSYYYSAQGAYTIRKINNQTWGSGTNPVIVCVDARYCSYAEFDGQNTGTGILILRGNVRIPGNLHWNGLVIVYASTGSSNLWIQNGGSTKIVGSLMLGGSSSGIQIDQLGEAQVLFSSTALRAVKNVARLNKYFVNTVSQWYE